MKVTILIILIILAGFIIPVITSNSSEEYNNFYDEYGFSQNNMLEKPYTLITSIFMHSGIEHLLSNILVLLFFGLAVESELGRKKMLLIFFLGAFAGDFLSLFFYSSDTIAIGASAGIFALLGTGMLVKPIDVSFYPFIIPIPLILLGMLYILYNIYGFIFGIDPNVSYVAHFGGLFVGLLFGFRKKGWKTGLKIMMFALGLMVIIPLLWFLIIQNL